MEDDLSNENKRLALSILFPNIVKALEHNVHIKRRHSGIGEPLLSYNMNSSKKWNGDFNQFNTNNTNDNPPFTFATQRRESQEERRSDRNHPFYDILDEILKVKSLASRA